MKTSPDGREFLERHEGVVLKAYRCPAGIWTIGAGLTSASGVVKVTPGMRITAEKARSLLGQALVKYERSVANVMPGAKQHEFDAGVSFHFNTGAIGKASWVRSWIERDWDAVRVNLAKWRKGGGKVLPGLVRRRQEEFDVMHNADYGTAPRQPVLSKYARVVVHLDETEVDAARAALSTLGYHPGSNPSGFAREAIKDFQRDHDLTVDGIVGRATLSTLQRRIDMPKKAAAPTVVAASSAGGQAVEQTSATGIQAVDPIILWVVLGAGLLWLAYEAWRYRDVWAAKIARRAPRLATWLRGS